MAARQAWDLPSLLAEVAADVPDIVLIDIGTDDAATLVQISLDIDPKTRVVVFGLSTDRESEIISAAEAGAAGLHLRSETYEHLLT